MCEVLGLLMDVVPSRSAKPVLQNIQIKGNDNGTITLSATDLEIGMRYEMEVDGLQDPDTVLLPGSRLNGLVRDDWANTINFNIENDKAEITSENGKFHLVGQSSDDFPAISDMPTEGVIEMSGAAIVDAVSKTMFSTAKGDTRYALNGILLHIEKKAVEFVSSDTHRLSLVKKESRTGGKNVEAIVITKGMNSLARLADNEETVKIFLTAHELIAQTSSATMMARLVDGQFPRYKDVIPKDLEKSVSVNRELLIKTLRLSGQVTNEETRSVCISAEADKLVINSSGSESGDGRTEIPAEVDGEGISVSFNFVYLLDVLKTVSDEKITIRFRDSESPARLDIGDFTHIIMPIRPRG
ncbi:MAG: DNA polymerase III subunit beta [Planctomycetes bacterium]|nr:DNA polymerase III subunit beta [Planctomycetota bacterium]